MAKFFFDFRGYVYQSGLNVLRSGFATASRALADDAARIEADIVAYEQSGVWEGERDEDGYLLWDREHILDIDRRMALEAQDDLRKAFVLSAYHHWERSARLWTNDQKAKHDALALKARAQGISIHSDLAKVRDLANSLKHNSEKSGAALVMSWPNVLPLSFARPKTGDWYNAVSLTDDHVREAFDIIGASGPMAT
jgi:hypothetical protein